MYAVVHWSADNLIYTLMWRWSKAVSTGQERNSGKSAINATKSFSFFLNINIMSTLKDWSKAPYWYCEVMVFCQRWAPKVLKHYHYTFWLLIVLAPERYRSTKINRGQKWWNMFILHPSCAWQNTVQRQVGNRVYIWPDAFHVGAKAGSDHFFTVPKVQIVHQLLLISTTISIYCFDF
jgi:hypothetical protein